MPESFDVIVIGGGPGGYVAAIRAAQLGKKVAVVERDKPGGRCLNYACIPAKTVLRTAEIYDEARNGAELGIVAKDIAIDWKALGERRASVSETLSNGVQGLWKKNKIELIEGDATLDGDANVEVGGTTYEAGAVVLATGSVALPIPGVEFGDRVLDTWGAWSLPEQPKRIAVVGAGASGSEIASAYGRFGTEVLLIEMLDQILPAEDRDMAKVVERAFKKQNITIATGNPVENVEAGADSVKFTYGGESAEVDYLCIAGGRGPDVDGLGLEAAGVELEENGKVKVDEYQRTSNQKVYAIGDLVNAKALAHKASEEGVVAVEHAAGVETHPVDQNLIAGATFCHPQVASVGLTEAAAKEAGHDVRVGKQKIAGEGAGIVYDDKDGLVKLVVDAKYGEILGAHIVGNRACDMIAELIAAIELEGGYQEIARTVHPHPTVSEAVLDAARAVDGWAIHAYLGRATFYFDLGSPYAYLSAERISPLFAEAGLEQPEWRPILLGGLFREFGRDSWAKGPGRAEGIVEVERRAAEYGLPPIVWPDPWPGNTLTAMRAATFAKQTGRTVSFALAGFRQAFAAGRDLTDPDNVIIAAAACELHPRAVSKAIETAGVKEALRAETDAAAAVGVKGVPAVVVGENVFWGDDRLEDAVAAAAGA